MARGRNSESVSLAFTMRPAAADGNGFSPMVSCKLKAGEKDELQRRTQASRTKEKAALKAAFLVMDYAPLADIENRLEPLRKEGRPYRSVAREAWAMAQVGAGKGADARQEFVVLSQGLDTSETARARAQAMIAAIDSGAAAQTPAILRAPQVAESAPVQPQAPAPQP